MKAVIVDIEGEYAVALDKEGRFIKIRKTSEHIVGYEIDLPTKVIEFNKKTLLKIVSVAAVLLLVSSISFGVYSYNLPYSYVNVDINPSLEIVLNIYNRIIDVKALNSEGEKLIEDSYRNSQLNEGMKKIIDNAVAQGFLKNDDENTIMLTVAGKDSKKVIKIKEEVESAANKVLNDDNVVSEVIVENVALERREKAKELGISPGKMVLIEKLKEVNPQATTDEYKDKPVKEIVKSIKDMEKDHKENNQKDDSKDSNKDKVSSQPNIEPLSGKKTDAETRAGIKGSPASPDAGSKSNKDNGNSKVNNDTGRDNKDNKASIDNKFDNGISKDNKDSKAESDNKFRDNIVKDGKINSDSKINNHANNKGSNDSKTDSSNKFSNGNNKDIRDNKNSINNDKPNNEDKKDINNKDNNFQYNPYWNPNWNPYWIPKWNPYWENSKEKAEEMGRQYKEWLEKMGEQQKKQYNEWLEKLGEEQKKQYNEWIKKMEEMKKLYEGSKNAKEGNKDGEKENKPDKPFQPGKDNIKRKN